MKALTVCQPWAWLIIHGPKLIENRTWRTNYRGPLAIHAGKSRRFLDDVPADELRMIDPSFAIDDLAFGAVIGTVELVDCVPVAEVKGNCWAAGPRCWVLKDPRPLAEPIEVRGRQLLWNLPDEIADGLRIAGKGIKGSRYLGGGGIRKP